MGRKSAEAVPELTAEAVELARAVVTAHCERELEIFEDVVEDFANDPVAAVGGQRLNAPVGIGIDLVAMTPYVLSAAGFLGGMVLQKVGDDAYGAVRDRVKAAWQRRRAKAAPDPDESTVAPQVQVLITVHLTEVGADEQAARQVARWVVGELLGDSDT